MIDLFEIPGFLAAEELPPLLAELRAVAGAPATVSGGREAAGAVEPQVRMTTRIEVAPATRERVKAALVARKAALEEHFGVALGDCEEPQFLRYRAGDFFVAHQDGGTGLIMDDTRHRKVSVITFLAPRSEIPEEGTYGGGSLVLHGRYPDYDQRLEAPAEPGTLVAFRSDTTHEVMPITHGERYTVVTWFR